MATPFDSAAASIPVTVVTSAAGLRGIEPDATLVRVAAPLHAHEAGMECVACAARSDIRALLFDLLQGARRPVSVVVDATALASAQPLIERLRPGAVPALGLRDHTVARSFHLARVL